MIAFREVVVDLAKEGQQRTLSTRAVYKLGGRITDRILNVPGIGGRGDQVGEAGCAEPAGGPVRFMSQQDVEVVAFAQRGHIVQRVTPGPIPGCAVVLVEGIGERRLGILGLNWIEAYVRPLVQVEPEPGGELHSARNVNGSKYIPEDFDVLANVVFVGPRFSERIRLVAQPDRLSGSKVPTDVKHGDDRLHQDVLAQKAALADAAIVGPTVEFLERDREILTDGDPA